MHEIHPMAQVDPSVELGDGCSIGPFSIVEEKVTIGGGTHIHSHVRIGKGTRIGTDCRIHHGVCIGLLPQSLGHDLNEETFCTIGDRTVIREFASVHRATKESVTTRVGGDVVMHPYSHVGHDNQIGNHVVLESYVQLAGHVHIGDHSILRGVHPVHQFTHIGRLCELRWGTGKDVPPFIVLNEQMAFGGVNRAALIEHGFTEADIDGIEEAYRVLFQSGMNTSQALERLGRERGDSPYIREIIEFVRGGKRGIIKGRARG